MKPLVTVVVPAYNHEKYIIECLDSIANQTFKNFQWIVVDDCSKDRTAQILKEKKMKYGYQLILHEKNMGLSATLTDVLSTYAEGKYISLCASDDFWEVEKLAKQVEFLEKHPDCAIVYGKTYYVNSESVRLQKYKYRQNYKGGYVFKDIITQNFHPPVNYMYRHSVLKALGYYKSGVIAEDFYMNCLIAHDYKFGYIPEFISSYRVEELEKKRDPFILMKSHLYTIELFKGCQEYEIAIRKFYLRSFRLLSRYQKYKIVALKYMLLSYRDFFSISYWKSIILLFYKWEKIYI